MPARKLQVGEIEELAVAMVSIIGQSTSCSANRIIYVETVRMPEWALS